MFAIQTGRADEFKWDLKRDEDGIQVYTRTVEGSKYKAVRAVITVEASLSAATALIRDTTACPQLADLCRESYVDEAVSETELYVYSYNDMPWPVKDRDAIAHVQWRQDPDSLEVRMDAEAIEDRVPLKQNVVRLKQAVVSWTLNPLTGNRVRIETQAHIDPEGPVPAFVTNLLLISSPASTMSHIRALLATGDYDGVTFGFVKEPTS